MALAIQEQPHPVAAGLARMHRVLDGIETGSWSGMAEADVRAAAAEIARMKNRLDAHAAAAARRLEGSGAARRAGAVSTGDLLGRDMGHDRRAGTRLVNTARTIAPDSATEQALAAGDLTLDQARIISGGLRNLPDDTTRHQRRHAESTLIADAARMDPQTLRARADRISDQWAPRPDVDRTEATLLAERERRAWRRTELRMWTNGDGTTSGRFTLPDVQATMLKTVLDGFASPRRTAGGHGARDGAVGGTEVAGAMGSGAAGPVGGAAAGAGAMGGAAGAVGGAGVPQEYGRRLGQGFAELIERLPTDQLPQHGGNNVSLAVTIDLGSLTGALEDAAPGSITGSTTRVSPGEVRRMACNAKILPMVFAGGSVPLDLGRGQRLFSAHQRRAIAVRDHGCTFPGCDRPPGWTEAHHVNETWAAGGTTDLADAAMVCAEHHRQIHHEGWRYRLSPDDGKPEYQREGSSVWQRNQRWVP